jgi:hypothetical protein
VGLFDRLLGRPLDQDGFAQRVLSSLASAGVAAERDIVYDPAAFSLRLPDTDGQSGGVQGTLNLATLYAEYLRSPRDQREGVVNVVVSMAMENREQTLTSEEARSQLRVQLRPRAFAEGYAPVRRVMAGSLELCVCLDRPTSMQYVVPSDLHSWDLDTESAFQIGLAGLERDTGTEGGFERNRNGVYRSVWKDTYDATRAALPWLIRKVPASGGHAIGIPNRNTLLVADLADEAAVLDLSAITEREANDPRRVSYRVFTLAGDTLVPLLSEDAPAAIASTLRKLERLDIADQYATQKERLERELEARGEDVYVGSASVVSRAPDEAITYTVWTQDADSLLPETDVVVLVLADGSTEPVVFPFVRLSETLGDLLESAAEHGFPPRRRVRRFPTPDEIAALGEPVAL